MKRKRHTEEQIIAILKEHEAGMRTADLCRKHGISEASFYNWKAIYGPPPVGKRLLLVLDRLVCINLSGLLLELGAPLAMMGSARPRPS
jgi:putative transposase